MTRDDGHMPEGCHECPKCGPYDGYSCCCGYSIGDKKPPTTCLDRYMKTELVEFFMQWCDLFWHYVKMLPSTRFEDV